MPERQGMDRTADKPVTRRIVHKHVAHVVARDEGVVDSDQLDVGALHQQTGTQTADATKPVDGNADLRYGGSISGQDRIRTAVRKPLAFFLAWRVTLTSWMKARTTWVARADAARATEGAAETRGVPATERVTRARGARATAGRAPAVEDQCANEGSVVPTVSV